MIYYIGNREMDMVKIGYSRDEQTIQTRIKQIQTYCPFHVEVIKVIDGSFQEEQSLHIKYEQFKANHKNKKNEWFCLAKIEEYEKFGETAKEILLLINDTELNWRKADPVNSLLYNYFKKHVVFLVEYKIDLQNSKDFLVFLKKHLTHFTGFVVEKKINKHILSKIIGNLILFIKAEQYLDAAMLAESVGLN